MQREIHGGNVYGREVRLDFSVNINPLGMPQGVRQAITEYTAWDETYPDIECTDLRRAIAQKEGIAPEQILCGNGASELLMAVVRAAAPEKCAIAAPSFSGYERAVRAAGAEPVFYELSHDTGFGYETVCDRLSKMTVQMLFLCNPNNPTGGTVDRAFLIAAAERCRECGCLLVVDECFNKFLDDAEAVTMKPYLEQYPNLVILDAFTKIYAMPGLRLGYCMTANERIREKMRSVMQPWSVSTLAQVAGEAALEEEFYVYEVRTVIREERSFLEHEMRKLGLTVFSARANFIFFKAPEDLAEKLLAKSILIRDCSNYRGLKKGYFRIAVRGHRENEALMRAFAEVLS